MVFKARYSSIEIYTSSVTGHRLIESLTRVEAGWTYVVECRQVVQASPYERYGFDIRREWQPTSEDRLTPTGIVYILYKVGCQCVCTYVCVCVCVHVHVSEGRKFPFSFDI